MRAVFHLSLARPRLRAFIAPMAAAVLLAGNAHAATRDEQSKACRHDAFRLCSADIPSKDKIEACMKAHYAQLSPACKTMFDEPDDGAPDSGDRKGGDQGSDTGNNAQGG